MYHMIGAEMNNALIQDRQREWREQAARDHVARVAGSTLPRTGLLRQARAALQLASLRRQARPATCESA